MCQSLADRTDSPFGQKAPAILTIIKPSTSPFSALCTVEAYARCLFLYRILDWPPHGVRVAYDVPC